MSIRLTREGCISVVGSVSDAAEQLAAEQEHFWNVKIPTEFALSGELVEVGGVESLKLATGNREGITPRYKYGEHESGVTVSTIADPSLDIIAHIDDRDTSAFLDHGVAWLRVSRRLRPAVLHFNVYADHGYSSERVEAEIKRAGEATTKIALAVLASDPLPPYSHGAASN